jgi:hypothetical protein
MAELRIQSLILHLTFRTPTCHNRLLRKLIAKKGVKNYLWLKKNRFWIENLLDIFSIRSNKYQSGLVENFNNIIIW